MFLSFDVSVSPLRPARQDCWTTRRRASSKRKDNDGLRYEGELNYSLKSVKCFNYSPFVFDILVYGKHIFNARKKFFSYLSKKNMKKGYKYSLMNKSIQQIYNSLIK